jgi:hypothetical protein
VCAFHEGLVAGIANVASGEQVAVHLRPFVAPGLCRIELSRFTKVSDKPAGRGAKPPRSSGPFEAESDSTGSP